MNFQHAIIKDIAWLIKSPGLLMPHKSLIPDQQWFDQQYRNLNPALKALDSHVDALLSFERGIKPAVGDYFEKLIGLWLIHRKNITQIKQHQLVYEKQKSGKRTVGEFDFLFIDKSIPETSFHWEVAIKFYLQVANEHNIEFLGPNAKDSLAKKTDKMLKQQLNLSLNPNAQKTLEDYPKPIQPVGILKGMLFYPSSNNWQLPNNLSPDVPENHLKGWWSHAFPLNVPQQDKSSRWFILQKPFWLTVHTDKLDIPYKINDLKVYIETHFEQSSRPLLLAEVMQTNKNNWLEISRGFIVSEHWPQVS